MNTVPYLLIKRTVEHEKQPLIGNGCVTRHNGEAVGSDIFCVVRAEVI
jgi:hypothetical protein